MNKKLYLVLFIAFIHVLVSAQDTTEIVIGSNLIEDAYINSEIFDPNGNGPTLMSSHWIEDETPNFGRSLLKFDLSDIPERFIITAASLSLFHDSTGHSNIGGENSGVILRVAEDWADNTVIWYEQPLTSIVNAVVLEAPDSSKQDYTNIDLTKMVQNFVDHPDNSNGIMVKLFDEVLAYRSLVFASVDNENEQIKPKLNISYVQNVHHDTIVVLQPGAEDGKDAYVNVVYGTPNGSRNTLVLSVWNYNPGGFGIGRSLLEFDLSEIPPEFVLRKAELSLFHNYSSVHYGHSTLGGANNLLVQRIIEPWAEDLVYWDNQPETTEIHEVVLPSTHFEKQQFLNIDVTEMVNDIFADNNYGFLLRLEDESYDKPTRSLVFGSSDHEDPDLWPKLELFFINTSSINNKPISPLYFNVFPNPTKGTVNVELSKTGSSSGTYSIINPNGLTVLSGSFSTKSFAIDATSLPKGMYAIRLINNGSTSIKKLIIL